MFVCFDLCSMLYSEACACCQWRLKKEHHQKVTTGVRMSAPEAPRPTLDDASNVLEKRSMQLSKDFARMRMAEGVPRQRNGGELLLHEYMQFVVGDPETWLASLPVSWTCLAAVTKGKTVMTALVEACTCDGLCDPEMGRDVAHALAGINKKMLSAEASKRLASKHAVEAVCHQSCEASETCDKEGPECEDLGMRLRSVCLDYCRITDNKVVESMLRHLWTPTAGLSDKAQESVDTLLQAYDRIVSNAPPSEILAAICGR
jgi:hypothetical protein